MARIKAVIFDMDGVLIDTEPVWRAVERDIFAGLGLRLSEEQLVESMGVPLAEVVRRRYQSHPWEGPKLDEVAASIETGVIDRARGEGEPAPGAVEALAHVRSRGLPIAIASSSSHALIDAVIDRLGIGEYIDALCSGDDEVAGKPNPAVFLTAARRLGVAPAECLTIEDSPVGVLAAKRAGMLCVALPDPVLAGDEAFQVADLRLESLEHFSLDTVESELEKRAWTHV
ncbi:MAG: hexitol phosphatase HxpB [Chloroflexota bacterium]